MQRARHLVGDAPVAYGARVEPDLIFVDLAVLQFRLALLLEGDDNQGNEDVDEEEREHYEVHHVEDGHFDAKVLNWTLVFVRRRHRVLQHSGKEHKIMF
jgi:hypothetical protein